MHKEVLCGLYRTFGVSSPSSSVTTVCRSRPWLTIRSSSIPSGLWPLCQLIPSVFNSSSKSSVQVSVVFLFSLIWCYGRAMMKVKIRSSLFWDVSQLRLVVSYRRFGTALPLKIGTSVTNYQFALRNIPEERRPHLSPRESLKSREVKMAGHIE